MTWDDTTTNTAIDLWNQGLSASQIASRIGGVSRNAVIGRLHRLGHAKGTPRRQPTIRKALKPRVSRITGHRTVHTAPAPIVLPLPLPRAEDKARVSQNDLEPHHCRFPVGEPTEGFCGLQKMEGSSYCEGHHVRCHGVVPWEGIIRRAHEKCSGALTAIASLREFESV